MPAYHSSFSDVKSYQGICSAVILPLKTTVKGPAPPCPADSVDIVDEAIDFFRANVLFRNFKPAGPADLVLCYLTVYISEVLRFLTPTNSKTLADAKKNIIQLSMSTTFNLPGQDSFCFAGFFAAPNGRSEQDLVQSFLSQLRQETANRLLPLLYTPEGLPNKWWFMFRKRKFMNIDRT